MAASPPPPVSMVITGASSGIGRALALAYAGPGVRLALSGRDRGRLEETLIECRQRGAEAVGAVVDVADRAAMADWIAAQDRARPLDLVIANAGISAGAGGKGEDEEQTRTIFAVNLAGVINTVWPAISAMRPRRAGRIAIVSSIAGFRGIPGAPAYSASKAAVMAWGDALRGWLGDDGIRVSVVCPGYVRTRMTAANRFPMPFLMDADQAARIVKRGIERNKARIVFPWPMHIAAWLLGALPVGLTDPILRRMPKKE